MWRRGEIWPKGPWNLSLRGKLLLMMFGLLVLVLATMFGLYWRAEQQLIAQVERHTADLSTAIQIGAEQLTSKGRTSDARLQDYVQRLKRRGVGEIFHRQQRGGGDPLLEPPTGRGAGKSQSQRHPDYGPIGRGDGRRQPKDV